MAWTNIPPPTLYKLKKLFKAYSTYTGGNNSKRKVIRHQTQGDISYVVYKPLTKVGSGQRKWTDDGYCICTLEQFYTWARPYLTAEQRIGKDRL